MRDKLRLRRSPWIRSALTAMLYASIVAVVPTILTATSAGAAQTNCGNRPKCYLVSLSSTTFVPGATTEFTFTFTNESDASMGSQAISIGAIEISPPAGLTITSAVTSGGSITPTGDAEWGQTDIEPGQSASFTLDAEATCAASGGLWPLSVVQHSFNSNGGAFEIDGASVDIAVPNGSCA